MTDLQDAKEKLAEMLKKYPVDSELSVQVQNLYTWVCAKIQTPISLDEAKQIRANKI
jgi:TATA-box binding protein (TBP) (component of TFIID and TFIIIB)